MKYLLPTVILGLSAVLLGGCYTPLIEGAQEAYDGTRRDVLHRKAASGDAAAQYKLGNTYCCRGGGPMDAVSIYDNHKATYWYCQAARQNYVPAQLQLASLYSGHAIRGLHIALRASALVGTANTDLGVALMWASVAANQSIEEDATELRDEIKAQSTDAERAKAAALMDDWRAAPCQWNEVFPATGQPR